MGDLGCYYFQKLYWVLEQILTSIGFNQRSVKIVPFSSQSATRQVESYLLLRKLKSVSSCCSLIALMIIYLNRYDTDLNSYFSLIRLLMGEKL